MMSNPHDLGDGRAVTHDPYVPALDGLRGLAAILVAGAHYMTMEGGAPLSEIVQTLTGLGMTLFFVLSGFVIHYNYNTTITQPGGLRMFFVARFARLYPLYILLFLFDFAYTGLTARSACGQIGAPGELLVGPSFLSHVHANLVLRRDLPRVARISIRAGRRGLLVDQRRSVLLSGVCRAGGVDRPAPLDRAQCRSALPLRSTFSSSSIFCCAAITSRTSIASGLICLVRLRQLTTVTKIRSLRWLLYFNPAARLGEFIAGLTAAHVYLVTPQRSPALRTAAASAMTLIAIALTVGLHLWLYGVIAPGNSFIGRTASQLSAPLVAVTVYLIARYETASSHILSLPLPVRLGVASYSIYMLHEIVPSAFKRLGLQSPDIAVGWVTWAGALILLVLISSVSYALIEHPARAWLRALLAPRRAPVLTAPDS